MIWTSLILALAWVGYAHVGYPIAIWALSRLSPRPIRETEEFLSLSVIVAVHNGAGELRKKLEGLIALEYPTQVQIIVASDGSTDETDAIAREFADRGVELVRSEERAGKEAAQRLGIEHATGEILAFTDVSAELERAALREISRPFSDPSVGSVSSEDAVDSDGGEGAYVKLEMWLRELETRSGSIVGNSGSFFAIRRELGTPWPIDLASDFRSALEAMRRGLRAVSAPEARAHFKAVDDPASEWTRKVRTARRGIAVMAAYRDLLHPRQGRRAFFLWGHKVARYTAPFALAFAFVTSLALSPTSTPAALLATAQTIGYIVGAAGLRWPSVAKFRPARIVSYFVLVNASILVAWRYHLRGERAVTWKPTAR